MVDQRYIPMVNVPVKLTQASLRKMLRESHTRERKMRDAIGLCLTALAFELEQAQRRDDLIAGKQIAEAIKAGREALK